VQTDAFFVALLSSLATNGTRVVIIVQVVNCYRIIYTYLTCNYANNCQSAMREIIDL
jgi:hypothetical protein